MGAVHHILSKMKGFLVIGVLCGVALAGNYEYGKEVYPSSSNYDTSNEYITSYEVDEEKYPSHRPVHRPHQPHHSKAYRPHYKPERTLYRYEVEPQNYPQPQYYPQPQRKGYKYDLKPEPQHYPQYYPQPQRYGYRYEVQPQYNPQPQYYPRHGRGYSTLVPVSAKPFNLPKQKIIVAPLKLAKYDHGQTVDSYGGHQRTGYSNERTGYSKILYYSQCYGYSSHVPVYGELYQPKPVSALL